jgi:hypothetical protein
MPPRIYIACVVSYGGGNPHGCWTPATDVQAIQDAATAVLRDSPIAGAKAWFILDVDGFGGLIDESDDIVHIAEIGAAIDKHGPAFIAYASRVGPVYATVTDFEKHYQGQSADASESMTSDGVSMTEAPLTAFTPVQAFGIDPDDLTRQERRLYIALARDPHKVLPKEALLTLLGLADVRQLDSVALRLRRKLGNRAVTNVWGVGYRLAR